VECDLGKDRFSYRSFVRLLDTTRRRSPTYAPDGASQGLKPVIMILERPCYCIRVKSIVPGPHQGCLWYVIVNVRYKGEIIAAFREQVS